MHTNHLCLNMLGISFLLRIPKVYIIASAFLMVYSLVSVGANFGDFFVFT